MKTKNRQFLALSTAFTLALSIGVTSCKKDNDSPGESAKFSANISGIAYQPNKVVAFDNPTTISIQSYQIRSGDTVSLQLSFPSDLTVNSKFTLENEADLYYFNTKKTMDYSTWSSKAHGTVTFSAVDKTNKTVVGKFSGVIYASSTDSVTVKDGQFNVSYK
jgi:hypothetical protein